MVSHFDEVGGDGGGVGMTDQEVVEDRGPLGKAIEQEPETAQRGRFDFVGENFVQDWSKLQGCSGSKISNATMWIGVNGDEPGGGDLVGEVKDCAVTAESDDEIVVVGVVEVAAKGEIK